MNPRGVFLGILGGGVPPGSPIDPISEQKMQFSAPVFRPGLSAEFMLSLRTRLEGKQTNSSKRSNSHISLSFLLIWNWNDKYVHTLISIGATFYLFIYLFTSFYFCFLLTYVFCRLYRRQSVLYCGPPRIAPPIVGHRVKLFENWIKKHSPQSPSPPPPSPGSNQKLRFWCKANKYRFTWMYYHCYSKILSAISCSQTNPRSRTWLHIIREIWYTPWSLSHKQIKKQGAVCIRSLSQS